MANFWQTLSPHSKSLWRWAAPNVERKMAERWARDPNNRSLADKMYRQSPIREPDATRGFCSPLGGQAVPTQQLKGRR
jgi:hypothetical protein